MVRSPARGVGLVALIALLGSFCAARPLPAQQTRARPASRHPSIVQLQRSLTALFAQPAVDHVQWTMRVDSLTTDERLFAYNAQRLMVPASNQKLLTAAVAADRLGWDYRFTTRLLTAGPLDAWGNLTGDVYVLGDGDPSINPRHPERWGIFDTWAAQLQAMGIRVIDGRLIGDDNLIDEPGWGEGWSWDDLQFGYGAPASALQYHENQIEVVVGPGLIAGAPAIVTTSPGGSGLLLDDRATTIAAGGATTIDVSRWPGTVFLSVRGQIAVGAAPVTMMAAVDNPTQIYLAALRDALARHGIFVAGGTQDIDGLPAGTSPPTTSRELIVDRSPPLSEIVDVMLKWSRNEYAETLLTALSPLAPDMTPNAADTIPAPPRNASRGLRVLHTTLDGWGITPTAFRARDGSGLSRMDHVSADILVQLLTRIWHDPRHREPFRAALPLAGVSGTFAERLKDTPAAAKVWAKTGTLTGVRALSGFVETSAGESLVFSVLANNFVVPATEIDAIVDKALLALVDLPRRDGRR